MKANYWIIEKEYVFTHLNEEDISQDVKPLLLSTFPASHRMIAQKQHSIKEAESSILYILLLKVNDACFILMVVQTSKIINRRLFIRNKLGCYVMEKIRISLSNIVA